MDVWGSRRFRLRGAFALTGIAAVVIALGSCGFQPEPNEAEDIVERFTELVDERDYTEAAGLTSYPNAAEATLKQIFEGVFDAGSAGRAALTYMKRLPPDMPGATKAKLWIELVRHINNIEIIIFSSDMFTLPGGRYLFRGGAGESLFIESDGTMYRTRTVPLDRAATWEADYLQFTRIN